MSDDLTALEVSFSANIDDLMSAGSAIDDIFAGIAQVAASSGGDITSSLTSAAESFSMMTEAGSQISVGVAGGVSGAVEALDTLPSAGEEASSSLSSSIADASGGFASLEDAVSSLASSVNDAVSQINTQIESIATTSDEAAAESQSSFSGFDLGGMVNSVGMGIFSLQNIGNMAAQTAGALLGPAMAAENTQASFTNLLGSSKAASDELSKLNSFASQTQFKTQDIDNAASSLIAFKTPAQDVVPDLTAVGDALTAVGKGTPDQMQGVVNILGKIGVQGHLTAGDITQLGSHGIDAMSAIEKGSGLSASALADMIKNGTLPADQAIKDLTTGIESNPVYSGGMAKQAQTLSGQMSTLGSNFDQIMAAALAPALPGLEKVFGSLATTISSPSFKQFATTLGTDIVGGITNVVTGIEKLVDTGKSVTDFFTQNQTAMDGLEAVLAGVGVGVLAFAAVQIPALVIGFGAWAIGAGTAAIATLAAAAPFILIGVVAGAAIFGIVEAVQHWGVITSFVGGVVKNVIGGVGSFFAGIGHDIQGIFSDIGKAAQNVGSGIESAFKGGVNGVIEGLNWLINAVDSFHVTVPPLVVAGVTVFGGVDLGLPAIPDIPLLASGGVIGAGQYGIAGEAGAELIYGGSSGVSVMSAAQSAGVLGGGNSDREIHVHNHNETHIYMDGKEITNQVMTRAVKTIRGQGGRLANI